METMQGLNPCIKAIFDIKRKQQAHLYLSVYYNIGIDFW